MGISILSATLQRRPRPDHGRSTRPLRGLRADQKGQSLVEVVIATLLTATVITGVFTVVLTTQKNITISNRKVAANYSAQLLLETLKNYVTADNSNAAQAPAGSWTLPGDQCAGTCAMPVNGGPSGPSNCYALDWSPGCVHNMQNVPNGFGGWVIRWLPVQPGSLPIQGMDQLFNMTLSYVVTDETGTNALATARPRVDVTVQWQEQ